MPISKEEINAKILAMSLEERNQLQGILAMIVECYGEGEGQAAMVFSLKGSEMAELITVNCNEMDAAELIDAAEAIMHHVNVKDAPPREQFN
jgi:hypothetical protein